MRIGEKYLQYWHIADVGGFRNDGRATRLLVFIYTHSSDSSGDLFWKDGLAATDLTEVCSVWRWRGDSDWFAINSGSRRSFRRDCGHLG